MQALCKDLERVEVKKWLAQILEILMAERAKPEKEKEYDQLDALIKAPWSIDTLNASTFAISDDHVIFFFRVR